MSFDRPHDFFRRAARVAFAVSFGLLIMYVISVHANKALLRSTTSFIVTDWESESLGQELLVLARRGLAIDQQKQAGIILGSSALGAGFDGKVFVDSGRPELFPIWFHSPRWQTYLRSLETILQSSRPKQVVITAFVFQHRNFHGDERLVEPGFTTTYVKALLAESSIRVFSLRLGRYFLSAVAGLKESYWSWFSPLMSPTAIGLGDVTPAGHSMKSYDKQQERTGTPPPFDEALQQNISHYTMLKLFEQSSATWEAQEVDALDSIVRRLAHEHIPLTIVMMPLCRRIRSLLPDAYERAFREHIPATVPIIAGFDNRDDLSDGRFRDCLHLKVSERAWFSTELASMLSPK